MTSNNNSKNNTSIQSERDRLPINPFEREDWISYIISKDKQVGQRSYRELKLIEKKQRLENNLFSISNMFNNTIKAIASHAFVSIITAFLALTAVSGFAAQTFAPQEFKPSTIINNIFNPNNEVKDSNSKTPLKPDRDNYSVGIDKCGITVKYPKMLGEIGVFSTGSLYEDTQKKGFQDGITIQSSYDTSSSAEKKKNAYLLDLSAPEPKQVAGMTVYDRDPIHPIQLKCFDKGSMSVLEGAGEITRKEVIDESGWFAALEGEISNIKSSFKNDLQHIYFDYEDLSYEVIVFKRDSQPINPNSELSKMRQSFDFYKKPGIFINQVQVQFNKLAQNETDVSTSGSSLASNKGLNSKKEIILKNKTYTKFVNDEKGESFKATEQICGTKGLIRYQKSKEFYNPGRMSSVMFVGNKSIYTGNLQQPYQAVDSFLNRISNSTPSLAQPFWDTCSDSGIYGELYKELTGIEAKGYDRYRIVLTNESTGGPKTITLRIIASVGDNIISLARPLSDIVALDDKIATTCGSPTAPVNETCKARLENEYDNEIDSEAYLEKAKKNAVELLKEFEIE